MHLFAKAQRLKSVYIIDYRYLYIHMRLTKSTISIYTYLHDKYILCTFPNFRVTARRLVTSSHFCFTRKKNTFLLCVGIAKDLDGQKWEELYHQILLFNAAYDTLVASRGFIFFQLIHCCLSIEKKSFSCRTMTTRWWQLQIFFMFTPNYLGFDDPILTFIFFKLGWLKNHQADNQNGSAK